MARICPHGPDSNTSNMWPMVKPVSAAAVMKWMERALCRPPSACPSQPQAASAPGLIAMPVAIISGSRMKMTTP